MKDNQSSNDLLNKISELSYSANVEGIATNIIETADACNIIAQYFNELQPQWVSADVDLPKKFVSVICLVSSGRASSGHWTGSTWSLYNEFLEGYATHWQPQPLAKAKELNQ